MAQRRRAARFGSILRLESGRRIGYLEWGDPAGAPLVYFHGTPGSRLTGRWLHDAARDAAVRVIVLERPGYGLSDPQPGRSMLDWASDVAAAAATLGLDRFAVAGQSGGGPYVCAVAHELADRVTVGVIMAGAGPLDRPFATSGAMLTNRVTDAVAARVPFLFGLPVQLMNEAMVPLMRERTFSDPMVRRWFRLARSQMPAPDREIMDRPGGEQEALEDLREALTFGLAGLASDTVVLARPWGFALEAVEVPMHLWHGDLDRNVPLHQGRDVAARLPHGELTVLEGYGHLLGDHWKAALQPVAEAAT